MALVYSKIVDISSDGANFIADIGEFSNEMQKAEVVFRLDDFGVSTTLVTASINVARSISFSIPRKSIGKTFEIYAYSTDSNKGFMLISIQ